MIREGKITECSKLQFFELLDVGQRKKISWFEFACNVRVYQELEDSLANY